MAIKNARILLKRTATSGKVPTGTTGDESGFIKQGELAINTADKKIFSFDGTNIFEPGENSFLGLTGGTINGNLSIQGSETETQNLTVHGNMIIEGTSFTSHTENIYVSANTITLNNGEINSGVTKGYAGILVDRGTATQYEFAFEESSDTFRVGETGNTQAVATREDFPINGGYAYWNESEYKFDTTKDLSAATMSLSTLSADTIYTHSISGMSPVGINGVVVENASISADTLTLAAGTTSKAPIQLTSGDLLTSVTPGAMEFNLDDYYVGISTGADTSYTSQYPPAYNDTYVKATTKFSNSHWPFYTTDPSKSLIGINTENQWMAAIDEVIFQRFHIDLGSAKSINRIYYENTHYAGAGTDAGVKNFTLWGSNSTSDFADLVYVNDGTWTQITGLNQTYFDQHVSINQPDPKYITFPNTTAYRYYAIKIINNWGNVNYLGIRRIELQTGTVSYPRCPIVLADENKLTENKLPIATTNGRLVDSLISQTTGGTVNISGNTNTLSLSATSISASTLFSGGTNLYDIFESSPTIPGGSDTQIQYNANGSFSGDPDFSYVNGNVGIGTTSPTYKLDVKGTSSTSGIRSDIGFDINPVLKPATNPTFTITAGSELEIGQYYYAISYYTAIGETSLKVEINGGITSAGLQQITLTNIPVSSDYRVIGKRIYRGHVGQHYNCYFVAAIANNATTYIDSTPDVSLGTTDKYYQNNTTTYMISVNGLKSMILDLNTTAFGYVAGGNITTGGRNALFGSYAGSNITSGQSNILIGHSAGSSITAGSSNIAIGEYTCRGAINNSNIYIGPYVGYSATATTGNVSIGSQTSYKLANGNYNTLIGYSSGWNNVIGSYNVFVGSTSGKYETGSKKLIIDSLDRTTEALGRTSALIYGEINVTPTNQILSLGGGGNVGINTTTPSEKLTVSGNTYISGNLKASTISATTISASTINTGTIEVTETGTTQLIMFDVVTGKRNYVTLSGGAFIFTEIT